MHERALARTTAFLRGVQDGLRSRWPLLPQPDIIAADAEDAVRAEKEHWILRLVGVVVGAEGPRLVIAAVRGRISLYGTALRGLVTALTTLSAHHKAQAAPAAGEPGAAGPA